MMHVLTTSILFSLHPLFISVALLFCLSNSFFLLTTEVKWWVSVCKSIQKLTLPVTYTRYGVYVWQTYFQIKHHKITLVLDTLWPWPSDLAWDHKLNFFSHLFLKEYVVFCQILSWHHNISKPFIHFLRFVAITMWSVSFSY